MRTLTAIALLLPFVFVSQAQARDPTICEFNLACVGGNEYWSSCSSRYYSEDAVWVYGYGLPPLYIGGWRECGVANWRNNESYFYHGVSARLVVVTVHWVGGYNGNEEVCDLTVYVYRFGIPTICPVAPPQMEWGNLLP